LRFLYRVGICKTQEEEGMVVRNDQNGISRGRSGRKLGTIHLTMKGKVEQLHRYLRVQDSGVVGRRETDVVEEMRN
jgi:hypothetical protein